MTGTPTGGTATAARFISRVTCALILAPLFLVGCGADVPVDPPTSSSPVTSSPVLPTPVKPAPTKDSAGVDAVIRYFWQVVNYTTATGDGTVLRQISSPDCKFCTGQFTAAEQRKAAGQRVEGALFTPVNLVVPPTGLTDLPLITLTIAQTASRTLDSSGDVLGSGPATAGMRTDILLEWTSSGWETRGVAFGGPSGTAAPS